MMKRCRVSTHGVTALQILFVLFGLFGMRLSAAQGLWSLSGIVPSIESEGELKVPSPNGRRDVVGTKEGLRLIESGGQLSIALPVIALAPLWEVIWAPNSLFVAVNASDGGAVGTWDATVFKLPASGPATTTFAVSSLVRKAANNFANCDSPEDVNVALVGWEKNGAVAHVVAEVPPHSSCKNMGSIRGYRVGVRSEKILEVLTEPALKKRWAKELGLRFQR